MPSIEVGAVNVQHLLVYLLGFQCVLFHYIIGAEDKVAQFVVGMGFDEGLAALPRLLVDFVGFFVFSHPIVPDVGFRGNVEALVADGGNQFVEGLFLVAVFLVKLQQ